MDLGQKRRGVDMGPTAMRIARLIESLSALGHNVTDYGNIQGPDRSTARPGNEKLRYLDEVLKVCGFIADRVSDCVTRRMFPLVLGGDQTVSIGTLAGLAEHGTRRGIIWIDAHADFNTADSTPSGNIHGMALGSVLGYGNRKLVTFRKIVPKALEENTVIIGCRSIDRMEKDVLSSSKVTVFTMMEVDEMGISRVIDESLQIAGRGVRNIHVSFDIDVLDPREAPGTGTPVPGGLTYREAHLVMEDLHEAGKVSSAELVEVNPILDTANHTAEIAVELLESLMGKRIYSQSF